MFFGYSVEEVVQKFNGDDVGDDDVTSLRKRNLWGLLTSMYFDGEIWGVIYIHSQRTVIAMPEAEFTS